MSILACGHAHVHRTLSVGHRASMPSHTQVDHTERVINRTDAADSMCQLVGFTGTSFDNGHRCVTTAIMAQ